MQTTTPAKPVVHFVSAIRGPAAGNWFRQTPDGDGHWEQAQFVLADEDGAADWLVVFDDLTAPLRTRVPWSRRMVFLSEPPHMKRYALRYLNQFGVVVGPVPVGRGYRGRVVMQQPALPWYYGVNWKTGTALGWDAMGRHPVKSRRISVVASAKDWRPLYRERRRFVEKLKQALGAELDEFGHGVRPVDDKAEAIAPYRYHVVLENNKVDRFWTEKLADAYLGEAFPIYSGGGELDRDFDPASFATIDVSDSDRAVAAVRGILAADPAAHAQPLLQAMHERVMKEHNVFAICERIIRDVGSEEQARLREPVTIHPSQKFCLKHSFKKSWRNLRAALGLRRGR